MTNEAIFSPYMQQENQVLSTFYNFLTKTETE